MIDHAAGEMYDPQFSGVSMIDDVDSVIRCLAADSVVRDRHVGFTGSQCGTYAHFIRLKEIATDTTLLSLLESNNPVLRVYGYWALIDRNYPKGEALLSIAKNDPARVHYMSGCIMAPLPVADIVNMRWNDNHSAVK